VEKKIENIVLIGAGNIATHLALALSKKSKIIGVYSKNGVSARELAFKVNTEVLSSLDNIPSCDLILICAKDDAIDEIINQIPTHFSIAYTSGSVDLHHLPVREKIGVFYPLQTFTKDRVLDIQQVPFFIEGSTENYTNELIKLASSISENISIATSDDRKKMHLAAIFINNFSNHLATLAKEYIENEHLNWEYLKPLIKETTNKILDSSPKEMQTGPARRNDKQIIEEHIRMLSGTSKEIYTLLSKSISDTYFKNQDK